MASAMALPLMILREVALITSNAHLLLNNAVTLGINQYNTAASYVQILINDTRPGRYPTSFQDEINNIVTLRYIDLKY